MSLYVPTPIAPALPDALQGAQSMRFNWGPDPLLSSPDVDLAGCSEPDEDTVAFFGAVDSRPLLYLMSVTLLSVRRFHPQAGYFVLVPAERAAAWSHLVHGWSAGTIRLLEMSPNDDFGTAGPSGYSRMTFHRHRVPELLVRQGFAYSINLDPDVLCVQPWDLRVLCRVGFIAGRRVGKGSRTIGWLKERLAGQGVAVDPVGLESYLNRTLGITAHALSRIPELNGGVIIFNNLRAVREGWLNIFRQRYHVLKDVVEGDQDLISLTLAANPALPRFSLPATYNYAFRRDRERLPPQLSRRLRHGMFAQAAINIHFVMDGKPWQRQNLTVYPAWLATARLYQIFQWQQLAQALQPSLLELRLTASELQTLGPDALRRPLRAAASKRSNETLIGLVDGRTRLACRCFLRGLGSEPKADPGEVLLEEARMGGSTPQPPTGNGAGATPRRPVPSPERRRRQVLAQRRLLLRVCGGSKRASKGETRRCAEIAKANTKQAIPEALNSD